MLRTDVLMLTLVRLSRFRQGVRTFTAPLPRVMPPPRRRPRFRPTRLPSRPSPAPARRTARLAPRTVRAEIAKGRRAADVFLPDKLVTKLRRFWTWKTKRCEDLGPAAALFCNQSRRRISRRRVQFAWRTWHQRAGFDRLYPFHCLRHSSVTNVYRATRDLFLAQRFARHVSPLTTTIYTHPSDDEARIRLRGLLC